MIRPKSSTKVRGGDRAAKLKAALKRTQGSSVSVGVLEGAGSYPDGTSVVDVALYNEFGTVNIPERSFLRSSVREAEADIKAWRAEAIKKLMEGTWGVEKALSAIGLRVQIVIQNKIKSNVPPPNAPSTVAAKARRGVAPRTLIDTTLLLRSVSYRVHMPNGQGSLPGME